MKNEIVGVSILSKIEFELRMQLVFWNNGNLSLKIPQFDILFDYVNVKHQTLQKVSDFSFILATRALALENVEREWSPVFWVGVAILDL